MRSIIFSLLLLISLISPSYAQTEPVAPQSDQQPETSQPETSQPETSQPETSQPENIDSTEPTEPQTTDSTETKKSSRWQYSLTFLNRTGFRLDRPRVFQMSRTTLTGKAIYKLSDKWRFTFEGKLHYDPVERLGYPKRVSFDPRQILIDGQIKRVGISIGLQQTVWGEADGLRVLDVINPLDYREFILEDFLDSRRPLWTVRADIPLAGGSLQLIWVPYFAPGRLPGADDEFGFGSSFNLALNGNSQPLSLPIIVNRSIRPAYTVGASQTGARYRRSLGRWDVSLNYFRGWEDIPTPNLTGIKFSPGPTLLITPNYDRKNVFGGTATTNYGPVVLRLEGGWSFDRAVAVKRFPGTGFEKHGQFASVVGLDYSPREWLWMSGQYFLQAVSAPTAVLAGPRYHHLASIFLRFNFFRDTLKPELFILTGLNQKEYLIRPRITRSLNDHWSIGAGVDLFGGSRDTIFGLYRTRDRAVVELKWVK